MNELENKRKALINAIHEFDLALKENFDGCQVSFDVCIENTNVLGNTCTGVETVITEVNVPITVIG